MSMRKILWGVAAFLLVGAGFYGFIVSLFLPLIFLDMDPPSWLSAPLAYGVSLGLALAGVGAAAVAWRKR